MLAYALSIKSMAINSTKMIDENKCCNSSHCSGHQSLSSNSATAAVGADELLLLLHSTAAAKLA